MALGSNICIDSIIERKVIHTFQELSTSGNIFVSCCPPPPNLSEKMIKHNYISSCRELAYQKEPQVTPQKIEAGYASLKLRVAQKRDQGKSKICKTKDIVMST